MRERGRTRDLCRAIHNWTGVGGFLLLFVICFSGAVAVFEHEVRSWESPALRGPPPDIPIARINRTVAQIAEADASISAFWIELPLPDRPTLSIAWGRDTAANDVAWSERIYSAYGGHRLPEPGIAEFLKEFHIHLHLPGGAEGPAQLVTGIAGMLLLLSIVTGVLAHPGVRRRPLQAVASRYVRTAWLSLHRQIGLWIALFGLVIALTAIPLALHTGPWIRVIALGAVDRWSETRPFVFGGLDRAERGERSATLPLDELLDRAKSLEPDLVPERVSVTDYGYAGARVEISGDLGTKARDPFVLAFSGTDGRRLATYQFMPEAGDVLHVFFDWVHTLHFGQFGGLLSRLPWFLLGLGLAATSLAGGLLWLRQQARASPARARLYIGIARSSMGVSGGLVAATLLLFHVQLLIMAGQLRVDQIGTVFFASWLLAALALATRPLPSGIRLSGWLAGLVGITVPIHDQFVTGRAIEPTFSPATSVNIGLAVLAFTTAALATRFTRHSAQPSAALPVEQRATSG